jgi:hypothetical protein
MNRIPNSNQKLLNNGRTSWSTRVSNGNEPKGSAGVPRSAPTVPAKAATFVESGTELVPRRYVLTVSVSLAEQFGSGHEPHNPVSRNGRRRCRPSLLRCPATTDDYGCAAFGPVPVPRPPV